MREYNRACKENQQLNIALKQSSKKIKTIDIEHEFNLSIALNKDVESGINSISQHCFWLSFPIKQLFMNLNIYNK